MELLYTRRYKVNRIVSFISAFLLAVIVSGLLSLFIRDTEISYNMKGISGVAVFLLSNLFFTKKYRKRKIILQTPVPESWAGITEKHVPYFRQLNHEERYCFLKRMQIFLGEVMITGLNMEIDDVTKILVASSAVIPVFRIPEWDYSNLTDVFVCSDNLNDNVELLNCKDEVLGLVIHNKSSIYLSKDVLLKNFSLSDGFNTGIHEFMHKIDEASGLIDGILPPPFLSKNERESWLKVVELEMDKLRHNQSDFREYALTSRAEFIAVAAEYFFERPVEMKEKHRSLYFMMEKMFRQDLGSAVSIELKKIFRK